MVRSIHVSPAIRKQSVFLLLLHLPILHHLLTLHAPGLEKVLILTADGRTLMGTLLSCDQLCNLVLNHTIERIIRPPDDEEASSEVSHGLYLIRGENVCICGLVDEELDESIDWVQVRGSVIGGVKHT